MPRINPSTFCLMCQQCGLSQQNAADYLGVSVDIIKKWWSHEATINQGTPKSLAFIMISQLHDRVDRVAINVAEQLIEKVDAGEPLDKRIWFHFEADDLKDPLPSGAKAAAGARCLAIVLERFGEEFAHKIFPVRLPANRKSA